MKRFVSCLILLVGFNSLTLASYFDTGWMEFKQPDGTSFIGRLHGDEYKYQYITKELYPFVKNYSNDYYYYAKDATNRRYLFSDQKVGIDEPVGIPKNLFILTDLEPPPPESKQKKDFLQKTTAITYTIKIVLVQFTDISGGSSYIPPYNSFTISDFEDMFSSSTYCTDDYGARSPDNENVYGSISTYFETMSDGNVTVSGIVKNSAPGGILNWLTLPNTKGYYDTYGGFFSDAEAAATSAGIDYSTNATTKVAWIYAGNFYTGNLNPRRSGDRYMIFEKWGGRGSYNSEATPGHDITFAHIGVHCHELGHTLFGFSDLYNYSYKIIGWCLMGDGCDNGGDAKGECPAPINPNYRVDEGWINTISPSIPNTGLDFYYSERNPTVYMVSSGTDKYYVENRRFEDYSSFLPGNGSGSGGMLVWHVQYGLHDLIEADGSGWGDGGTEDYGDIYPGSTINRNLNDFTTPADCKQWSGNNSNVILHDISDPAPTMTAVFGDKWFGDIPLDLTWEDNIEFGGDVTVPTGIVLSIDPGVAANLNSCSLKSTGGTINRDYSSTFTPDIRLVNGSMLKGQYSTYQEAFADAQSTDEVHICSDITWAITISLPCDVIVANNATLTIVDQTLVNLNGNAVKSTNGGTINKDGIAVFNPDYRLVDGSTIKGQYSSCEDAFTDAATTDELQIYEYESWNSAMAIPCDVRIPAGYSLTVAQNIQLSFTPNTRLTINGSIQAIGADGNRIVFTRSGSSGKWDGIFIHNASGADSDFDYITVEHSYYGIYLSNTISMITIEHANLRENTYGFTSEYSSPFL
ncbi:MAG: hypothetical protein GF353_06460, partial [Candidatus Lokiarchaeota archaeon]|nr:hypothetical protein [Candidatus Lokiarchaeota archaeon]